MKTINALEFCDKINNFQPKYEAVLFWASHFFNRAPVSFFDIDNKYLPHFVLNFIKEINSIDHAQFLQIVNNKWLSENKEKYQYLSEKSNIQLNFDEFSFVLTFNASNKSDS